MTNPISFAICTSLYAKKHAPSCIMGQAQGVWDAFESAIKTLQLGDRVTLVAGPCQGYCQQSVTVRVNPGNTLYVNVTPEDVVELIEVHAFQGKTLNRLAMPRVRFIPGF